MKISAISGNYTFKKVNYKTSFAKNHKNNISFNNEKKPSFVVQTAEAIVTAFAKVINSKQKRASITIPIKPKEIKLDPKKLRELPPKLKRQAIEELNDAITAEDKTKVIRKFGIWA